MILFLYGSDSPQITAEEHRIISEYKKRHSSGVNFHTFNAEESNFIKEISNFIKSASFFNEHKLAKISKLFDKKTTTENMLEMIAAYDLVQAKDLTVLILENLSEEELKTKNKIALNFLMGSDIIKKKIIPPTSGQALSSWIKKRFTENSSSISNEALQLLIGSVPGDIWRLENEIQKLSAHGAGRTISREDVLELVTSSKETNIFEITEAMGLKNKMSAFRIAYRQLATGQDPFSIFSLLASHSRNMIIVKTLTLKNYNPEQIAKVAKIHPFVAKKMHTYVTKFTLEELKNTHSNLAKADISIKKGLVTPADALFGLILDS